MRYLVFAIPGKNSDLSPGKPAAQGPRGGRPFAL